MGKADLRSMGLVWGWKWTLLYIIKEKVEIVQIFVSIGKISLEYIFYSPQRNLQTVCWKWCFHQHSHKTRARYALELKILGIIDFTANNKNNVSNWAMWGSADIFSPEYWFYLSAVTSATWASFFVVERIPGDFKLHRFPFIHLKLKLKNNRREECQLFNCMSFFVCKFIAFWRKIQTHFIGKVPEVVCRKTTVMLWGIPVISLGWKNTVGDLCWTKKLEENFLWKLQSCWFC